MYSSSYTALARKDLDEILQYISVELSNPIAASNLFKEIKSAISTICRYPESCPLVINRSLKSRTIRRKLIKNYTLYYTQDKARKKIYIIRIMYSKRKHDNFTF